MADFKQAIRLLRNGKRVRRPSWQKDSYWVLGESEAIFWKTGVKAIIHLNQIEADDWEIFRENPKPLSAEGFPDRDQMWYPEDKVRQKISELRKVRIEVVKYPCGLESCSVCNSDSRDVWFIHEGKKYHFKCLLKFLFGEDLI